MKETHLLGRMGSLVGVLTVGQDVVGNAELGSNLLLNLVSRTFSSVLLNKTLQ